MRRLPVGAEVQHEGVHFRVWAPDRKVVEVLVEGGPRAPLVPEPEGLGYFSAAVPGLCAGARYRFRLDDDATHYPDPASRFQPEGPHGPSEVVDPSTFGWTDAAWRGVDRRGQVLYEMHVGTFTPEGTWAAAAEQLPELAALGVTVIEMMPVAEFAGTFGWGYDSVDLFAPTRNYGRPDELRRFVDRAHALGIGVILDVVYNHLGPSGAYVGCFARAYYTSRYKNDWGEALNFDGDDAAPVRELFVANAGYWVDEFHVDGLRLDATQDIHDDGKRFGQHILAAIGARVRQAAGGKKTLIVCENEPQDTRLVRALEQGGFGLDAAWNDDYHHAAMVALSKRNEAYYADYRGSAQELVSSLKWGYLFQGQHYRWQKQRRGKPALDLPPEAFVTFLQNHDQIANSFRGDRCHVLGGRPLYRALLALTLLGPATPMLFQGQEFCASAPFLYFADHEPALAAAVREGRAEFLRQFPSLATPSVQARLLPPEARATFDRCKLDLSERVGHAESYALCKDLLAARKREPLLREARRRGMDGAALREDALVLRYFGDTPEQDRLVVVNLGKSLDLSPCAEPLLAPPDGCRFRVDLATEDPKYGGLGAPPPESEDGRWSLTAECAYLLAPVAREGIIGEVAS